MKIIALIGETNIGKDFIIDKMIEKNIKDIIEKINNIIKNI